MSREFTLDSARRERTGLDEAIFCAGKSVAQLDAILAHAESDGPAPPPHPARPRGPTRPCRPKRTTRTRLRPGVADRDPRPRGPAGVRRVDPRAGVVTAGSSDVPDRPRGGPHPPLRRPPVPGDPRRGGGRPLAAARAPGRASAPSMSSSRSPAWRRRSRASSAASCRGRSSRCRPRPATALRRAGDTALRAVLTSCAPGITVVNIDNGYGAACAAARILNARPR